MRQRERGLRKMMMKSRKTITVTLLSKGVQNPVASFFLKSATILFLCLLLLSTFFPPVCQMWMQLLPLKASGYYKSRGQTNNKVCR